MVREVDLRMKRKKCTENPVIKLTQLLREMESNPESLKLILDEREIPFKALRLLAEKRGLTLKLLEKSGSDLTVLLSKPNSS